MNLGESGRVFGVFRFGNDGHLILYQTITMEQITSFIINQTIQLLLIITVLLLLLLILASWANPKKESPLGNEALSIEALLKTFASSTLCNKIAYSKTAVGVSFVLGEIVPVDRRTAIDTRCVPETKNNPISANTLVPANDTPVTYVTINPNTSGYPIHSFTLLNDTIFHTLTPPINEKNIY